MGGREKGMNQPPRHLVRTSHQKLGHGAMITPLVGSRERQLHPTFQNDEIRKGKGTTPATGTRNDKQFKVRPPKTSLSPSWKKLPTGKGGGKEISPHEGETTVK